MVRQHGFESPRFTLQEIYSRHRLARRNRPSMILMMKATPQPGVKVTSEKWQLSDQAAGYYETYLYQLDSIPDSPYPDALANALKTHLSLAAGNGLRAPFAKSYQADFQTAVSQAGFTAVHVEAPTLDFRISDLNEYVRGPHGLASIGRRDRSASKRRKTKRILSDVRRASGPV